MDKDELLKFGKFKGYKLCDVPAYWLAQYVRDMPEHVRKNCEDFRKEIDRRMAEEH